MNKVYKDSEQKYIHNIVIYRPTADYDTTVNFYNEFELHEEGVLYKNKIGLIELQKIFSEGCPVVMKVVSIDRESNCKQITCADLYVSSDMVSYLTPEQAYSHITTILIDDGLFTRLCSRTRIGYVDEPDMITFNTILKRVLEPVNLTDLHFLTSIHIRTSKDFTHDLRTQLTNFIEDDLFIELRKRNISDINSAINYLKKARNSYNVDDTSLVLLYTVMAIGEYFGYDPEDLYEDLIHHAEAAEGDFNHRG